MPDSPSFIHAPTSRGAAPSRGFTLIELAVVLFLVALLLGALLGPVSLRLEAERRREAAEYLAEAKYALIGFAMRNGRLPCPDTSGSPGLENRSPACACEADGGPLPHATLGIRDLDPWGRRLRYVVSPVAVIAGDEESCQANEALRLTLSAAPGSPPFIALQRRNQDKVLETLSVGNAAVLISFGASNAGQAHADSDEGRNGVSGRDNPVVVRPPNTTDGVCSDSSSAQPSCHFDDIVDWISLTVLQYQLVTAGRLP